jgi:hypothetical protein
MMEADCTFKSSVSFCGTTKRNIQSDSTLQFFKFISTLFKSTFSATQIIQRKMKWWSANNELEKILKETVKA